MASQGNPTAQLLAEKKSEILAAWMEALLAAETLREDLISKEESQRQSEELLDAIVEATTSGNLLDIHAPEYKATQELLSEISSSRAKQGISPRDTAVYIFSLKDSISKFLRAQFKDDPELLNRESRGLSRLIDSLVIVSFETYLKGREEIIRQQQEEILELSTPVITIWDGVLVVPLVGTLDSARTQVVMENLLQKIVTTGSQVAILEISGVPMVDTLTAQHLLKTISAAHLMGADCIISGIRPSIAQTIVHLGIDLSQVITKATLADALKQALTILGISVNQTG